MNSDPLDDLLAAYAKEPLPPAAQSRAEVWREIESRRKEARWLGLFPVLSWRDLFAEPRLAIAGLIVALVTGALPVAAARAAESTRLARESLHLDVFTTCHCSPCLPGSMMSGRQKH